MAGILEYSPDSVGFTCYDFNYRYVRLLTTVLKKTDPDLTIILGGPTATFSHHEIMEHTPEIDICVRGEGEKTVLDLLQKGFTDLEGIQGITFRRGTDIVSTPDRPLISGSVKGAELDVLPSPYLTHIIPPDGTTGVLTSRGCVHHCVYCNFSAMFSHTIRYHSVNRVIKELKLICDHWDTTSGKKVVIFDDTFSVDVKRAKTLCEKIIEKGISLPFFLQVRADNCDRELIELMRDAGVERVNFGLESASLKVLKAIKKVRPGKEKQFLTQVKMCVQWAKEAGITTAVSVIFGLPQETQKEAEETLHFIKELNVDEYSHNYLMIYAGTELFSTHKKYNLKIGHSPFFLPYITRHGYDVAEIPILSNSHMQRKLTRWKKMYSSLLSGGIGTNENGYEYLIIKKIPENYKEFCSWLKRMCVLPLSVIDMTEDVTKERARRLELFLHEGVPAGLYFTVVKGDTPQLLTLFTLPDLSIPISEKPFHQYSGGNALYTLEKLQDIEALTQFIDAHTEEGTLSLSARDVPELIGTCIWTECLCPALSSNILVVHGDDVLSCFHGGCIGVCGDSKEILQKNIQNLFHKKEKERQCHTCPVNRECSRCLFPPLPDSEFCNLKRIHSRVLKSLMIMEGLNRLSKKERVLFRLDETAPPLFYHGELSKSGLLPEIHESVRLLSFGKKAVVFTTDDGESYFLGKTLAAILEAFQLGIDEERLISYLCESAKADRKKALRAISYATLLFGKIGILK